MSRKHKEFRVDEVVRAINKKSGVFAHTTVDGRGTVEIDKQKLDIGNSTKGKIDFLVNHAGFTKSFK